jgi:hypothetical protein
VPNATIEKLARRYRLRLVGTTLVSFILLLAPLILAQWRFSLPFWAQLCAAALMVAILGAWLEQEFTRVTPQAVAEHLNRTIPDLEESAHLLLLHERDLATLQRLQKSRIADRLQTLTMLGSLNRFLPRWPPARLGLLLVASGMISIAVVTIQTEQGPELTKLPSGTSVLPGDLTEVIVQINPPAYIGMPERSSAGLAIEAEQGSSLEWRLVFGNRVRDVRLEFDDGSELVAGRHDQGVFRARRTADSEAIYRLAWYDESGPRRSSFERISLLRDQPPLLQVTAPDASPTNIPASGPDQVIFSVEALDDHGIGTATILATVAKGEGEGVKFRDVELAFDISMERDSNMHLQKNWILSDLGMTPGDELYFRAVVRDKREPVPNQSQTAMLMVRWETDAKQQSLSIEGIAVDLVPEYFRSQRQLIIDTEKLIADAQQISRVQGTDRSRGLAFDQKSLRLRYGQYLGEEYSTDIGYGSEELAAVIAEVQDPEQTDGSYAEHLEHDHAEEEHGPASATVAGLPEFMASFVHAHDSAEQSTLFDEKTKATLKGALAAMWDAELELHLSRPHTALPHEYRALRLIKEVQQANRIYVRRAGFEPPPLDEEKRMTGELDGVQSYAVKRPLSGYVAGADLALLMERIEAQSGHSQLTPELARSLAGLRRQLGNTSGEVDLRLAVARLLDVDAGSLCLDCLDAVHAAVWKKLPGPVPQASRKRLGSAMTLGQSYFRRLEEAAQ